MKRKKKTYVIVQLNMIKSYNYEIYEYNIIIYIYKLLLTFTNRYAVISFIMSKMFSLETIISILQYIYSRPDI